MELEEILRDIAVLIAAVAGIFEALRRIMRKYNKSLSVALMLVAICVVVLGIMFVRIPSREKAVDRQAIEGKEKPFHITVTPDMKALMRELRIHVQAMDVMLLSFRERAGDEIHKIPRGLKEQGIVYIEGTARYDAQPHIMPAVGMLENIRSLQEYGAIDRPDVNKDQDLYNDLRSIRVWDMQGLYALPIFGLDSITIIAMLLVQWDTVNAYGDKERKIIKTYVTRMNRMYTEIVQKLDAEYAEVE